MATTVDAATTPSMRGARSKNPGAKRVPSDTPINTCPRLTTQPGTALSDMPPALSATATISGPIIQGLGARSHRTIRAPATVSPTSSSRPGHQFTAVTVRNAGSLPCTPSHWNANGMTLTTSKIRRLCAATIRSTRAP